MEDQINADLKDLRNKATFVFFMCNALWLGTTFFLQAIGTALTITVPKILSNGTLDPNSKIYIDPIGLMFILSFASLLVIQYLAMLWHRVQTLIHFISYIGTESKVNRKLNKQPVSLILNVHEDNDSL